MSETTERGPLGSARDAADDADDTDDLDEHTIAVRGFYDSIVEYEWRRLDAYVFEHATVRHFLERYLPKPPARIIDVGSGPGRYAVALAQQGYDVTLVDLSPRNVAWAAERIAEAEVSDRARAMLGDARSLAAFSAGEFDVALLLGPLYHLPAEQDRKQAIRELRRVLRDGGVAFTMMLTRAAAIFEGINRWPEGALETQGVDRLLATGGGFNFERDPHDFEGVYFAHVAEVLPLHEAAGLRRLALAGCEAMLGGRRETLAQLPPEVLAGWVRLVLQTCEDPEFFGASERLLFVGKAV